MTVILLTFAIFSEDLEFGPVVAKGCNAVVYSARWARRTPPKEEMSTEKGSSDVPQGSYYQYIVANYIEMLLQFRVFPN